MDIKEQYNQALQVFNELAPGQVAPSLADIEAAVSDKQRKYLERHQTELVICPAITEEYTMRNLIGNFDKKSAVETYIWDELFDKVDFTASLTVNFVLPELAFTSQTVADQIKSLQAEAKSIKGLASISLGEYFGLQAKQWPAGRDFLDKSTYTRFVQYRAQDLGGGPIVLFAVVRGDQPFVSGSDVGYDWVNFGVRRGVRVTVPLNLEASLKPFSSETPSLPSVVELQKNTEALNRLTDTLKGIFK